MKKLYFKLFIISVVLALGFIFASKSMAALTASENAQIGTTVLCNPSEIYNVRVTDVRFNGAKIEWDTTSRSVCALYYGTSIAYSQSRIEESWIDFHYFNLTQLSSGTTYHFMITCANPCGADSKTDDKIFQTDSHFPEPATPVSPTTPPTPPEPPSEENIPITPLTGFIESIATNPWAQLLAAIVFALAIISVAAGYILPWISNIPMLAIWDQIWSFFFLAAGRKRWGIVYESDTKQPLPKAMVKLIDADDKRIIDSCLTDKEGRYGFDVKAGKYILEATKKDFIYPSTFTKKDYHSKVINVKDNEVLSIDIPVDANFRKLKNGLGIINSLGKILSAIRIPLLLIGTFFAVIFYMYSSVLFNTLLIALYFVLWFSELLGLKKTNARGNVLDEADKTPLGYTIVRVFDEKTGKLVSTKVSDEKGHYFYLIEPGEYEIKAMKEEFIPADIKDVKVEKGAILAKDILMKKK